MKIALLTLLVGYVTYGAVMIWLHPRFIYPFQPDSRLLDEFSRVELTATDGTPIFLQERPGEGPVLLYFMGNVGALILFEEAFPRHRAADRHIIAMEFRGGAGHPGSPSEESLKADALIVADYAAKLGKPLIIQGFSLGTGLATHVAARRDATGVILAAPYDRMCHLMASASWLPACLLPVQRWNSIADAQNISAPMIVLHGDMDPLIPPTRSLAFEPLSRRILIAGAAHNDIGQFPAFHDEIEAFIAGLEG